MCLVSASEKKIAVAVKFVEILKNMYPRMQYIFV